MSNHPHDEGELHFEQIQHQGVKYEDRDLGARGIIVFLIVLGVSGFILCVLVWGYFDYHARHMEKNVPIVGPQEVYTPNAEESAPEGRFPKPSLQVDDVSDLNKVREGNEQRLETYGYVDQKDGIVHIPIEQAMDQIVKQGLPTRPATPATQAGTQAPVADFGSGTDTVAGAGGGVRPENKR